LAGDEAEAGVGADFRGDKAAREGDGAAGA
jgi:hypothetical protein